MWDNTKRSNICVTGVQKERKKGLVEKNLKKEQLKCPTFGENQKFTDFKSSVNPTQDKHKEVHAKTYYNQPSEN